MRTVAVREDARCTGPVNWCLRAIRMTRPGHLLARTVLIGLIAITISGVGHVLFRPAVHESRDAAELVNSIAGASGEIDTVPGDLAVELGYEPVAAGGRLIKPSGSCSTPVSLGPDVFEEVCRTHDLGYDLLRNAEEHGERLGSWARFALDRRLYMDLLSTCETVGCRTAATAYYTAVTTNSIRQGYGSPTDEPPTPWVGVGLLVICFAVLTDPRLGFRSMVLWPVRSGEFPVESSGQALSGTSLISKRVQAALADLAAGMRKLRPLPTTPGGGSWRHRKAFRSTV